MKPSRDNNNYRCYNQDDISKIKFILLLREMDVTIEEIKQIINKQKSIRDVLENKKDLIDYSLVIAPVVAELCTTSVVLSAPPNSYQNNSQS